jgi:hypothetical protein
MTTERDPGSGSTIVGPSDAMRRLTELSHGAG